MIVGDDPESARLSLRSDEFERFALRASASLLRSAYLLTGDRGHAEDLLQETLWRTARRWHVVYGSPEAYAHEVLVNLSRDRRRASRRRPIEVTPKGALNGSTADAVDRLGERDVMIHAVRRLPRREQKSWYCASFLISPSSRPLRRSGCRRAPSSPTRPAPSHGCANCSPIALRQPHPSNRRSRMLTDEQLSSSGSEPSFMTSSRRWSRRPTCSDGSLPGPPRRRARRRGCRACTSAEWSSQSAPSARSRWPLLRWYRSGIGRYRACSGPQSNGSRSTLRALEAKLAVLRRPPTALNGGVPAYARPRSG